VDSNDLQQLLQPRAFPHAARDIELRETHISWVVLCGEFAYKIKKPVNFGFLDFSTPALRQHYCEQELALNRRFAPELYLAVVPITRDRQGLSFAGDGPVVDHAVKMRRFDEGQLLDQLAARGELDRALVRDLAREFARLHATAPVCRPGAKQRAPGTPGVLHDAIEQNFEQVSAYPLAAAEQQQLALVTQWTRRRFEQLAPTMAQRIVDGRVIDGHGDAHLGNIALLDGSVRLFDCIEFNPSLRIMDSIAEIAFLTMDLEARGYRDQTHWLLSDYLEYRDDFDGLVLLDLYRSYFAMVRAKVALLREPPGTGDIAATAGHAEFCRYLALAHRYCQPGALFLAITHGVSGSGKSTIADQLVAVGGALRIRSDVERKRLYGLAPEQRSQPRDEARLYSAAMSRKTFARLEQLAAGALAAGFAVIVDATFLHRSGRDNFRALAAHLDLPFIIIDCLASPAQLRRRLIERERQRQDASEAGVKVMESQLARVEPLADTELAFRMKADSSEQGAILWCRLQQCLGSRHQQRAGPGLNCQ
jgi:hypothetical protein